MTAVHFIVLFGASAISYYFSALQLAPFALLAQTVAGVFWLFVVFKWPRLQFGFVAYVAPALLFSAWLVFSGYVAAQIQSFPILTARYAIPVVALAAFAYVWVSIDERYRRNADLALELAVWIHVVAFGVQFAVFATTGVVIDLIEPVTGEVQRVLGGTYSVAILDEFGRMAGLFGEPGTYVNVLFPMYLLLKARKSSAPRHASEGTATLLKDRTLDLAVYASVVLSFSFFGYVFLIACAMVAVLFARQRSIAILQLLCVLAALVFISWEYIEDRLGLGSEAGYGFRLYAISEFVEEALPIDFLMGWGMLSDTTLKYPDIVFNDVGLVANVMIFSGAVGLVCFLRLVASGFRSFNVFDMQLLAVLLFGKLTLTYFVTWIFVAHLAHASVSMRRDRQ